MSDSVTVLVLTPSLGGFYFGQLLAGLGREVVAVGGRIVVVQTPAGGVRGEQGSEPSDFAAPVAWSEVDGVVSITTAASGSYLQQLRAVGKSVVLVGARLPDFEAPLASPDNHGGTAAAVEHLIGHGHRRIGFVGNLSQPDVQDRYAAYVHALDEHDCLVDPALLFRAPNNDWAGGDEAARQLLAAADRPTAVMVATDRNAIGLMRTLTDAGLRIPRDMAVVGFDNIEAAAFSKPALSSVNQRFDEVGALAGRLVLAGIGGEETSVGLHIAATASLELRASCGCTAHAARNEMGSQVWSPPDKLRDSIYESLRTGDSAIDDPIRMNVRGTVREIERLAHCVEDISDEDVQALTTSLEQLTSRPDGLRRITDAVIEYLQLCAAPGAVPRGDGLALLTAGIWRLQAGAFLRQTELTQMALEEQYAVDAGLLDWTARIHGASAGSRARTCGQACWRYGRALRRAASCG